MKAKTASRGRYQRKTKKRKRSGRPVKEKINMREVLIYFALKLFSLKGVKGTSGNEIGRLGKTTGAMVVYYFKSRERLVEAVVKERLVPLLIPIWDLDWQSD
ncbi:MAG: TetR family transcriptional regulator, partial [Syntrophomonadaceae bacterium]|nr:TetR family transcriptional regulator [Syntrophomonadaceae bacterium]